jgi:sarcosine oxidase subunit beta
MSKERYDVVIIGAGIAGVATAYFLAKGGRKVCIVEKSVLGQESTGRCAGLIGQHRRPPPDLPIAMRAVQLWKQLLQESDLAFEFRQQGRVSLAWTDQHAAELKAVAERDRACGLDCFFLDRLETRALVPGVSGGYVGSVYVPSDASAQPYLACLALARAARQLGATIHEHREVKRLEVAHGRISGVLTDAGPMATETVVNAAGAWSPSIARAIGVQIPAEVRRSHIMLTERLPKFIEPIVGTGGYGYFRQSISGNVLIGYPARPMNGLDRRVTYDAIGIAARRAAHILPRLRDVSLIRAFTGFTTWTPDLLSIIGPTGHPEGFYVATAFCGRGFAIGPAVGELMAELILTGRTSLPIDAYRLDRFAQSPSQGAREPNGREGQEGPAKMEEREA